MDKGRSFTVCIQIVVQMSQTHLRSGNLLLGFYRNLFKSEWADNPDVHSSFVAGLPQVTSEANSELGADLTLQELYTAMMSLQSGKAPGIDGPPVDFYKSFWPIIGHDLLNVVLDSLQSGRLPLSCRRAVITRHGPVTSFKVYHGMKKSRFQNH